MSAKKLSLAELMGKSGAQRGESGKLSLEHLPELLGDALPELPRNAVGRFRLLRSLKARLGPNFRSLPGVGSIVKEFDNEVALEKRIAQIRSIKAKRG